MDVQVEAVGNISKKLSFTVPAETVDQEITTAFRTLRKEVMLPGFRPGRVPRKLLEQRFGGEIRSEVSSKLISDAFDQAVEEHSITPVGPPDIDQGDLKAGEAFTFAVTVEVKPEISVENYSGLNVVWDKPEVADAEVDEQIEGMRHQSGSLATVDEDRAVGDGDVAEVAFTLSQDGVDDLNRDPLMIGVPEDHYHGFLVDLLKGAKKGESREGEVAVPGDYIDPEWAGKTVQAKLEVREIKKVQYPELNDDFAKDMGHDTVDIMKAALRFRIQEAKDKRAREQASRRLLRKIVVANPFEVPPKMIQARGESLVSSIAAHMMPGLDQAAQFSLDDLDDDKKAGILEEAEFAVRRGLVLEAIVRQEELKVSDEERDARVQAMAEESGQRPEAIRGYLMKAGGMEDLENHMLEDRAVDLLLERAEIVDEDPDEVPEDTPAPRADVVAGAVEDAQGEGEDETEGETEGETESK